MGVLNSLDVVFEKTKMYTDSNGVCWIILRRVNATNYDAVVKYDFIVTATVLSTPPEYLHLADVFVCYKKKFNYISKVSARKASKKYADKMPRLIESIYV